MNETSYHPLKSMYGFVIPKHNLDKSLMTLARNILCENISDPQKNPLRYVYEKVVGNTPQKDKEPMNVDMASPQIARDGLTLTNQVIMECTKILINVVNPTSEVKSFGQATQAINDLHSWDIKLFTTIMSLLNGSLDLEYGTIEELVLNELISTIHFHGTLITSYTYNDNQEVDVDTLRTKLSSEMVTSINASFQRIHKFLVAENLVSYDSDTHNFTQLYPHMFKRIEELRKSIDIYITDQDEDVIKYNLRFIKYIILVYEKMYKPDTIFKYNSADCTFKIAMEDWENYQSQMWVDPTNGQTDDMLDVLRDKTVTYISESHAAATRATLLVTKGLMQFDLFLQEVGDTLDEFIKLDHIDNNSVTSRQTLIAQYMNDVVIGYQDVTILEIFKTKNIREKSEIRIQIIENNTTKTIMASDFEDEANKHFSENKDNILKTIIHFVQELEVMFDVDNNSILTTIASNDKIILIAGMTLAACIIATLMYMTKDHSSKKKKEENHKWRPNLQTDQMYHNLNPVLQSHQTSQRDGFYLESH
jgi:hypothetical protein